MPEDNYSDKTISEILPYKERLLDAINGGSITSVGIAQGIRNDFAALSFKEKKAAMFNIKWSLYLRAKESKDAALMALYPNPQLEKVMKVSTVYGRPSQLGTCF